MSCYLGVVQNTWPTLRCSLLFTWDFHLCLRIFVPAIALWYMVNIHMLPILYLDDSSKKSLGLKSDTKSVSSYQFVKTKLVGEYLSFHWAVFLTAALWDCLLDNKAGDIRAALFPWYARCSGLLPAKSSDYATCWQMIIGNLYTWIRWRWIAGIIARWV